MNNNAYIDMHVHSTASDGTFTPSELVRYAIRKNLYGFCLTDHDTIDGIEEALEAAKGRILVVPGIEMAVGYAGTEIHILGLNIDYKNPEFIKLVEEDKIRRHQRNLKIIKKMNDNGLPVTMEKLEAQGKGTKASITRAHFARYLIEAGYVKDKNEAFEKYLSAGKPFYEKFSRRKPEEAINAIKSAGGYAVLAHPMLYKMDRNHIYSMVDYLKKKGLQGIECIYSCNRDDEENFVAELAQRQELFITGGSDFHGINKPDIDLGVGKGNLRIPKKLLENIGIIV